MFRYLFVAALSLSGGYLWGVIDGVNLADSAVETLSMDVR
jgi:hypothetical protein